jgi:hypothetical protein
MTATDLLVEITHAFQHELHPGKLNIVNNNSGYDLEVIQIRDSFNEHTWQTLPDELLQYEQGGYIFLSKQGLLYYLPAYLHFCIREYAAADSIPAGLVFVMTLPTEADILLSALHERAFQALAYPNTPAPTGEYIRLQHDLRALNQNVHRFINRWSGFSAAQGRAILHFLEHLRDEHGQDFLDNEPAMAIERYWFQFA